MTIRSSLREHWHYPVLVFVLVCLPALTWFLIAQATVFRVTAYLLFFLGTVWAAFLWLYYHSEYYAVDAEGITHHVLRQTKHLHWDECRYIGVYQQPDSRKQWFICSVDSPYPATDSGVVSGHTHEESKKHYRFDEVPAPDFSGNTKLHFRFDLLPADEQQKLTTLCGEFRNLPQEQQPPHPLREMMLRDTPNALLLVSPLCILFFALLPTLPFILAHYENEFAIEAVFLLVLCLSVSVIFIFLSITAYFTYCIVNAEGIFYYDMTFHVQIFWSEEYHRGLTPYGRGGSSPQYLYFSTTERPPSSMISFRKDLIQFPLTWLHGTELDHLSRFCGTDLRRLTAN